LRRRLRRARRGMLGGDAEWKKDKQKGRREIKGERNLEFPMWFRIPQRAKYPRVENVARPRAA
jgi:hypothetical protein